MIMSKIMLKCEGFIYIDSPNAFQVFDTECPMTQCWKNWSTKMESSNTMFACNGAYAACLWYSSSQWHNCSSSKCRQGWQKGPSFSPEIWVLKMKTLDAQGRIIIMWPYPPKWVTLTHFMKFWFLHTCKEHSFSFQRIQKLCKSALRFKSYW